MQVEWDKNICIHSGKCVESLPAVFRIKDGSFIIEPDKGSEEEIVGVINQCPSKALKFLA